MVYLGKKEKEKWSSVFRRDFVTKLEWKRFWPVRKYVFPLTVLMGYIVILLGNLDGFFIVIHSILGVILLLMYTKRKGTAIYKKGKSKRSLRIVIEILMILLLSLQMYDTVRYGTAMAQIQYKNDGYVTVTGIQAGELGDARLYANEYNKKDEKVYQHVFDGWKYLSKVDITENILREMEMKNRNNKE